MSKKTRIVIIEDDETIREGYAFLIGATPGFEIVKAYASYEESVKYLLTDQPDVILLDIEIPGTSGIEALPKIKKVLPNCHVLMLTVFESQQQIFAALANGASGYLTKNTDSSRIIEAIKEVQDGGGPMSIHIARMVISSFKRNQESPLSKRETQILERIVEGKSRSAIARDLFIEAETVRTHIKNIYFKLNVNSKAGAIKSARENRLI